MADTYPARWFQDGECGGLFANLPPVAILPFLLAAPQKDPPIRRDLTAQVRREPGYGHCAAARQGHKKLSA